jgi:hypothetical protein
LTQTFFIHQLFPCSQTADHTLSKFEFSAHASRADETLDTHPATNRVAELIVFSKFSRDVLDVVPHLQYSVD